MKREHHTQFEITAASIGAKAYAARQSSHAARVIGVTSRGLFLLKSPQQIVFVSFERYRSPLTINLDRSVDRLRAVEVGATARFSDARLIFPAIEFAIFLSADVVWHCPPPVLRSRPCTEQIQRLRAIAQGVLARRGRDGLAAILPRLIDRSDASPLSAEHAALFERLLALRCAVQTGDSQATLDGLLSLLGQGRGLTPSGDDVVIGLLLTLARSPRMNSRAGSKNMLKHVAASVTAEAYRKTTSISANLIECAADGQGDERLITIVDGIATGSASIDEGVDCVLDWGSSSGIDALVGMAIAVCGAS